MEPGGGGRQIPGSSGLLPYCRFLNFPFGLEIDVLLSCFHYFMLLSVFTNCQPHCSLCIVFILELSKGISC